VGFILCFPEPAGVRTEQGFAMNEIMFYYARKKRRLDKRKMVKLLLHTRYFTKLFDHGNGIGLAISADCAFFAV
jgi:hypothetical protein